MKEETPENTPLHYQNGQSDAEKLMRKHLQEPGHVISDEELKSLKIAGTEDTPTPANSEDDEPRPATPWDVIDS